MKRLLHVSASPRGAESESLAIANTFLTAYREFHPDDIVDTFDLWDGRLPEFGPTAARAKMNALAGRELVGDEAVLWNTAKGLFEEFNGYDNYLFSVPMWNHGIPYIFKQLIDVISQSGFMFTIDQTGYQGLLRDKKAAVIYTTGVFNPDVEHQCGQDFQSNYIEYWLKTGGVEDITTITFRGILFDADAESSRSAVHAKARETGKQF